MNLFNIIEPTTSAIPIILSSPHSGTFFPDEIAETLKPEMWKNPDDTDWFIDQLYAFAPALGITMITANYSRWVVDLNRDPESKPLYSDGRVITGLAPTTNFNGQTLYLSVEPEKVEIERRVERYFRPYHQKLGELLDDTKSRFGKALLFDAHSIRKHVPGIRTEPFPELILGDNDGQSASQKIIQATINVLQNSPYHFSHNNPFKGGYITRSFGKPAENIHALQLEMAKTNYMDDSETHFHPQRAEKMQLVLAELFKKLIGKLQ